MMNRIRALQSTQAKFLLADLINKSATYIKEVGTYIEQFDGKPDDVHFVEIDIIITLHDVECDELDLPWKNDPHHYITITLHRDDTYGVCLGEHQGCYWGEPGPITEQMFYENYEELCQESYNISEMLYNFLVMNMDNTQLYCPNEFEKYEYFVVAYGTKKNSFDDKFSDSDKSDSLLEVSQPLYLVELENKLKLSQSNTFSIFASALINDII